MAETQTIYGHASLRASGEVSDQNIYFRLHVAPEVTAIDCGNIGFSCARTLGAGGCKKLILQTSYIPMTGAIYERKFHVSKREVGGEKMLFLEEGPRLMVCSTVGEPSFPVALAVLLEKAIGET